MLESEIFECCLPRIWRISCPERENLQNNNKLLIKENKGIWEVAALIKTFDQ